MRVAARSVAAERPTATLKDAVKADIDRYKTMPARDDDKQCLDWWKETGTPALPILLLAARGHLSL